MIHQPISYSCAPTPDRRVPVTLYFDGPNYVFCPLDGPMTARGTYTQDENRLTIDWGTSVCDSTVVKTQINGYQKFPDDGQRGDCKWYVLEVLLLTSNPFPPEVPLTYLEDPPKLYRLYFGPTQIGPEYIRYDSPTCVDNEYAALPQDEAIQLIAAGGIWKNLILDKAELADQDYHGTGTWYDRHHATFYDLKYTISPDGTFVGVYTFKRAEDSRRMQTPNDKNYHEEWVCRQTKYHRDGTAIVIRTKILSLHPGDYVRHSQIPDYKLKFASDAVPSVSNTDFTTFYRYPKPVNCPVQRNCEP